MTIRAGEYEFRYNTQYLYDEVGFIIGVVHKHDDGWFYRSCVRSKVVPSWSDIQGPMPGQQKAIEACTVHYVTRLLEA